MKYYQQPFSQHRRQAKCPAVPLQIVELSHSHATYGCWSITKAKYLF